MKFAFLLASLFIFSAHASNERAQGVEIFECHLKFCVQLKTSKLYKSSLGSSYAFGPSHLKVFRDNKEVPLALDGFEGSFDPRDGRFYLGKKTSTFDYVIDTKDQQIYKFPRS